jgi:hypothetical protein
LSQQADNAIFGATAEMVRAAGMGPLERLIPVQGGANNRAFIVETSSRKLFLKAYFQDPADVRNRLAAEYGFSQFAWRHGIGCIPEPIAQHTGAGLALFNFVPGRMLTPEEVKPVHVEQALRFWQHINQAREASDARSLPAGSEACFSIDQHFACVSRRLQRLGTLEGQSAIDHEAAAFVGEHMAPAWQLMQSRVIKTTTDLGLAPGEILAQNQRCLSPSDFGFHNAILTGEGSLVFCDFEYAGWDDPAKVACDFFCQPRIPAPAGMFESFTRLLIQTLDLPKIHERRVAALLDVYRLKWCCIMLNEFLPLGARRRQFALSGELAEDRKATQLRNARAMFALIQQPKKA